ncbi:MAG: phage holin family protein [Clostridia bacterium]|nr:phage holin family protein [Clostridia bacterium]
MDKIFNAVSVFIGVAGGILAGIFGQWNTALWALVILMAMDYITGIIKAVYIKKLSSEEGYKGILKKITILVIVALANIVQVITGGVAAVREIVIMFYIANEGISVLENVAAVSTKMPAALKNILLQLRDRNDVI